MVKLFYYLNDINYPIKVTDETCVLTKYTFQENGIFFSITSLLCNSFFIS